MTSSEQVEDDNPTQPSNATQLRFKAPFTSDQVSQLLTVQQAKDPEYSAALCPQSINGHPLAEIHSDDMAKNLLQVTRAGLMCPHCARVYREIAYSKMPHDFTVLCDGMVADVGAPFPYLHGNVHHSEIEKLRGVILNDRLEAKAHARTAHHAMVLITQQADRTDAPTGTRLIEVRNIAQRFLDGKLAQQQAGMPPQAPTAPVQTGLEVGIGEAAFSVPEADIKGLGGINEVLARFVASLVLRPEMLHFAIDVESALNGIQEEINIAGTPILSPDPSEIDLRVIAPLLQADILALTGVFNEVAKIRETESIKKSREAYRRIAAYAFILEMGTIGIGMREADRMRTKGRYASGEKILDATAHLQMTRIACLPEEAIPERVSEIAPQK